MTTPLNTAFQPDQPSSVNFLFIRHGRTPRNAKGEQIQGWVNDKDAELDEIGREQAKTVGQHLNNRYGTSFKAIYSSPLNRCLETAELINKYLQLPQICKHSGFIEICHGQHDTMSFQVRNQTCEESYAKKIEKFKADHLKEPLDRFFKWKYNPLQDRPIPLERIQNPFEGKLETVYEVFLRATKALKEIAEEMKKKYPNEEEINILVSTHAGVVRTLADEAEYRERGDLTSVLPVYYEKNPAQSRLIPGNCSIFRFSVNPTTQEISFKGTVDLAAKIEQKV